MFSLTTDDFIIRYSKAGLHYAGRNSEGQRSTNRQTHQHSERYHVARGVAKVSGDETDSRSDNEKLCFGAQLPLPRMARQANCIDHERHGRTASLRADSLWEQFRMGFSVDAELS